MPSVTLLPTPEPEKTPIRWPRPQVSRPSIARTPVESGASIRGRSVASGGGVLQSKCARCRTGGGRWSIAWPRASITRPSSSVPTRSIRRVRCQPHAVAAAHAGHFAERINDRFAAAKADDFGFDRLAGQALDFDDRADRRGQARHGGGEPFGADDAAGHRRRQDRVELAARCGHGRLAEQLLGECEQVGLRVADRASRIRYRRGSRRR